MVRASLRLIQDQLAQGTSPEKIALGLSLGAVIGCLPVLGVATQLCLAAGIALRLNHGALQLANYAVFPVQFLLLAPYLRLGERLFGVPPIPLAPAAVLQLLRNDWLGALKAYGVSFAAGAGAWALTAPLAVGGLYACLLPLARRLRRLRPST